MKPLSRQQPAPFAVLDLGTARTTLLQVDWNADGQMRYGGHVSLPSQGMRKGAVIGLPAAAALIHSVAATLEARTGQPIERVFVSLGGGLVRGFASQAAIELTSRSHEVTREDARRVLDLARSVAIPEEREIIHVVPQEFTLDGQGGIHEPVGMLATRLEARVYAVTVPTGFKNNLVLAVNQGGLEVEEVVFAPLAAAEAGLPAEDRQAGVALIEMGAGATGVVVYRDGSLVHAGALATGGDHYTNDIAVGLETPRAEAERIKCNFGAAAAAYAASNSAIEVPSLGDQPPRTLPHLVLCEYIEARAREWIRLLAAELARAGKLGAGLVLSGGGSRLPGLREMLAASLNLPARIVQPVPIEAMPDEWIEPEFAFLVGACYYAHRMRARQLRPPNFWERMRQHWDELTR